MGPRHHSTMIVMGPIEAFPASSLNKVTPKLLEGLQLVVELEADALVGLPHLGDGRGSVVVHVLAVLERDDLDLTAPREGLADVAEGDLGSARPRCALR
jgi:hypothetical protein